MILLGIGIGFAVGVVASAITVLVIVGRTDHLDDEEQRADWD